MTVDKSRSPECGIYVRIDDFSDMRGVITKFRQMTMVINRASGYEKNMNIVEFVYSAAHEQEITDLIMLAQSEGVVAIISGNPPDFECYGADGILLDDIDEVKPAREKLGDDAIIGVTCGSPEDYKASKACKDHNSCSKDLALKAIKSCSDYVRLNGDPALISWFSSQSDILCVAVGDKITSNNCGALASAGASFVDLSDYIFNYEKGVMQATVNALHSLECATQSPKVLN